MSAPWQLVVALLLNLVIQAFQSAAYAARIAGVKTGQVAIAISLFGLVVTASRTANMFYAPMIGSLADAASKGNQPIAADTFLWQLRFVLLAATAGAILGSALIPLFVTLYVRGINAFNRTDSLFRAVLRLFDVGVLVSLARTTQLAAPAAMGRFPIRNVPTTLLVANLCLTAIYAVGVEAATYASVISQGERATALLLSGIINGFGTIALAFIVDPTSAQMVDRAVKGERTMHDMKTMVFWLATTSIVGTLLAQLLLVPAADIISFAAQLFGVHHS